MKQTQLEREDKIGWLYLFLVVQLALHTVVLFLKTTTTKTTIMRYSCFLQARLIALSISFLFIQLSHTWHLAPSVSSKSKVWSSCPLVWLDLEPRGVLSKFPQVQTIVYDGFHFSLWIEHSAVHIIMKKTTTTTTTNITSCQKDKKLKVTT